MRHEPGADGADGPAAAAALIGERQRLADAFAMHLSAVHPGSAAALVSDIVYGLVPIANQHTDGEQRALRIAAEFLERVGSRARPVVAVGPVAHDVAGLARSRVTADRVVRVLRDGDGSRRVACLADIHVEALMLELHDLVSSRGDRPTGAVAKILDYDTEHGTALLATLRAWLDAFGDVGAAAASVFVHPNTFRYRLRRLAEVGDLDLADPEARFAAMVQLRIVMPPQADA